MLVNGLKSGVVPSALNLNVRIRVDIALLTLIYQWKQTATSFIPTHKICIYGGSVVKPKLFRVHM